MTEPAEDPIVREVHEARQKLLEDAAAENKTLLEHLVDAQKRNGAKLVQRRPRKIVRSKTA